MLKKLCFEMRTVTKSNTERDFFSFMSKRRKYADVLPLLAQNKSSLHMACTLYMKALTRSSDVKKSNLSCSMKG